METHNQAASARPRTTSPGPAILLRPDPASRDMDSPPATDTVLKIVRRATSIFVTLN